MSGTLEIRKFIPQVRGRLVGGFVPASSAMMSNDSPVDVLRNLSFGSEGRSPQPANVASGTIAARLFDLRARCMSEMSKISMHLTAPTRSEIGRRITEVLDHDSFDEGDALFSIESFLGLLRLVIREKIKKFPALGISEDGTLLAAWWSADSDHRVFLTVYNEERIDANICAMTVQIRARGQARSLRRDVNNAGVPMVVLDGEEA